MKPFIVRFRTRAAKDGRPFGKVDRAPVLQGKVVTAERNRALLVKEEKRAEARLERDDCIIADNFSGHSKTHGPRPRDLARRERECRAKP